MSVFHALALAFSLFAAPAPTEAPAPSAPVAVLPPSEVLERYVSALGRTSLPSAMIFVYNVEQAGMHDMAQIHRIYRGDVGERDETLMVDGRRLSTPSVHVFRGRADRYDILSVAPRPELYTFTFSKTERDNGHVRYLFRTQRSPEQANFVVTDVAIDGESFLPSLVRFRIVSGSTLASGELTYGPVEKYWLIREALVNAKVGTKQVREHIAWLEYQFPASLPASTFSRRTGAGRAR